SLLLEALTAVVSERVARSQAWPSVPHVLSGHLDAPRPTSARSEYWSSGVTGKTLFGPPSPSKKARTTSPLRYAKKRHQRHQRHQIGRPTVTLVTLVTLFYILSLAGRARFFLPTH